MTDAATEVVFAVRHAHDGVWASARARSFAMSLGFRGTDLGAIAIVVSELVSNAVKFAGGGTVCLSELKSPRAGVQIRVEDVGPGIAEPSLAVRDGWSEGRARRPEDPIVGRRGLGAGLGAVQRLMDELTIEARDPRGTRVTVRKFLGKR